MIAAAYRERITSERLDRLDALLDLFAEVFHDPESYNAHRPDHAYLRALLSKQDFIALVALIDEQIVGGLVAYELQKFEQRRSEIYIYDLAVADAYRRQGIATALIEQLQRIAAARRVCHLRASGLRRRPSDRVVHKAGQARRREPL